MRKLRLREAQGLTGTRAGMRMREPQGRLGSTQRSAGDRLVIECRGWRRPPGGDRGREAALGLSLITAPGSVERSSSLSPVGRDPCPSLAWGRAWTPGPCSAFLSRGRALVLCRLPLGLYQGHRVLGIHPSAGSSYSSGLSSMTLSLGRLPCPGSGSGVPSSTTATCITLFLSILSVRELRGRVPLTSPSPSAQHGV